MRNIFENVSAVSRLTQLAAALLFLVYPINIDASQLVSAMPILTMTCLIFGLICFLREIYHSIHAFQTRGYLCLT